MDQFLKREKIAFLMPDFGLIGAQKMCLNIIEALDKSRFEPTLIVQAAIGELDEIQKLPAFITLKKKNKSRFLSKLSTLYGPIRLAREINKLRPDVIVSISPWMNFTLLFSTYLFKIKTPFLIIEEHQHLSTSFALDPDSHNYIMRFLYKNFLWLYNKADLIKCVSEDSKTDLYTNWRIKKEKIIVINPPVNTRLLLEHSKGEIPWDILQFIGSSKEIVMGLGRLENQKNFYLMIDSFSLTLKNHLDPKLVIIGNGKLKEPLRKYVRDNNLDNSVYIAGFVINPFPLFKIASAFCLTSIWEGMPVVIIEAMVLNCPVISVNCPSGPSEMIENNVNGLLVSQDRDAVAAAIDYVFTNPVEANRMSLTSLDFVKKWDVKFYIEKFIQVLENRYQISQPNLNADKP